MTFTDYKNTTASLTWTGHGATDDVTFILQKNKSNNTWAYIIEVVGDDQLSDNLGGFLTNIEAVRALRSELDYIDRSLNG